MPRALLALLDDGRHEPFTSFAQELAELARARGFVVVGEVRQERQRPDPMSFFGRGKVEEIRRRVAELAAEVVVVGASLTPLQLTHLKEALGVPVVDRTELILEIFAERATTREGKLQVELAALRYRLPRLAEIGAEPSRAGGGIGTRGPGETRREEMRRRILSRIHRIERELVLVKERRARLRQGRAGALRGVLVGYTNAGKSSLLEALAKGYEGAAEHVFATLDPRARRVRLLGNIPIVLTDSVGFVRDLPHELIHAFHATLEEVREADFLLHVVDAASADREVQVAAVAKVLAEIGAAHTPTLLVYNKSDLLPAPIPMPEGAVLVSAKFASGLEGIRSALPALLGPRLRTVRLQVQGRGERLVAWLKGRAEVLTEEWSGETHLLIVRMLAEDVGRLRSLAHREDVEVLVAEEALRQEEWREL